MSITRRVVTEVIASRDRGTARVVIEGADISSRCKAAVEWDDGVVMARVFVKRAGLFVLNAGKSEALTEEVWGRGHIFQNAGCCGAAGGFSGH